MLKCDECGKTVNVVVHQGKKRICPPCFSGIHTKAAVPREIIGIEAK